MHLKRHIHLCIQPENTVIWIIFHVNILIIIHFTNRACYHLFIFSSKFWICISFVPLLKKWHSAKTGCLRPLLTIGSGSHGNRTSARELADIRFIHFFSNVIFLSNITQRFCIVLQYSRFSSSIWGRGIISRFNLDVFIHHTRSCLACKYCRFICSKFVRFMKKENTG